MKRNYTTVLALILAFMMLLLGCSGNADKPSDSKTSDTSSTTSPTMEEQGLAYRPQPKKVTSYNTFRYVGQDKVSGKKYVLTFTLPEGLIADTRYGIGICTVTEPQTYTEDMGYFCDLDIYHGDRERIDNLINEAKSSKYDDYILYDDGILQRDPPMLENRKIAYRLFDENVIFQASFAREATNTDMVHKILADATVEFTEEEPSPVTQITGEEAKYGIPSDKIKVHKFAFTHDEEYEISFSLPEGVGYEADDFSNPDYVPDRICGIDLMDCTGYTPDANYIVGAYIALYDPEKYDLSNPVDEGIYKHTYTPDGEGLSPITECFRILDEKYVVYARVFSDNGTFNKTAEKTIFDFFKSLKVSKKTQ